MPQRRICRVFKRGLGVSAILALLGIVTAPWWLSAVAVNRLAKAGIGIESATVDGWSTWTLKGVSVKNQQFALNADAVTIDALPRAGYRFLLGQPPINFLQVENWVVDLPKNAESQAPRWEPATWLPFVYGSANIVSDYIVEASASNGRLVSGDRQIEFSSLQLELNRMSFQSRIGELASDWDLSAPSEPGRPWEASVAIPQWDASLALELAEGGDAQRVEGRIRQGAHRIDVRADLLETAIGFHLSTPDGIASVGRFEAEGSVEAGAFTVNQFTLDAPQANVALEEPIRIPFSEIRSRRDARINGQWQLATLNIPGLEGDAETSLSLTIDTDYSYAVSSTTTFTDANYQGQPLDRLTLSAEGDRDTVIVSELELNSTDAPPQLRAQGTVNVAEKRIENATIAIANLGLASDFSAQLSLAGPWNKPTIEGWAGGSLPDLQSLHPTTFIANVTGDPEGVTLDLEAKTDRNGSARVVANLAWQKSALTAEIQDAAILDGGQIWLVLNSPAKLTIDKNGFRTSRLSLASESDSASLTLDSMAWSKDEQSLVFDATEVPLDGFNLLLRKPLPAYQLRRAKGVYSLTDGNPEIAVSGELADTESLDRPMSVTWDFEYSDDNMRIHEVAGFYQNQLALRASGRVPLRFRAEDNALPLPKLIWDAPLNLEIDSRPNPEFWAGVRRLSPLSVTKPAIDLQLTGTLESPQGYAKLGLADLQWTDPERSQQTARLSDIQVELSGNAQSIEIQRLTARNGSNTLDISAALPLEQGTLRELVENRRLPRLDELKGRANIFVDDLEAFGAFLPPFLERQGEISIEGTLNPGYKMKGQLRFDKLSSQRMPYVGRLTDIAGKATFEGNEVEFEDLKGFISSSPFNAHGNIDLTDPRDPEYDILLRAEAFPFVKTTDVALRGNASLRLQRQRNQSPSLVGVVTFKNSILPMEPELFSGTISKPVKPPYFSINTEPFDQCRLDVVVKGDNSINISNSLFQSTLGLDARLSGTLGNPILAGKARISKGTIQFPASTFSVANGELTFSDDPDGAIGLDILAKARVFGYDATLSIAGTSIAPEITVTTTPAIRQIDALLLVTTGTLPGGNLSRNATATVGMLIGREIIGGLAAGTGAGSDRLEIEIGRDISQQGKRTIGARYRLGEQLEARGEYDERDEYNLNLLWTLFQN